MAFRLKHLTQAACLSALVGMAPAALAQYDGDKAKKKADKAYSSAEMQAHDAISEKELKKYVKASEEVGTIRDSLMNQINGAEDQETAQTLQHQAQEKMVEAVEDAGLDVDTYNRIAGLAQSDPAVRERIQELR